VSTFIQVLLIVAAGVAALVALAVVLVYASVIVSGGEVPPYRRPLPPGDGDWGEPLPPEGEGT
jgi:hypothetical protein